MKNPFVEDIGRQLAGPSGMAPEEIARMLSVPPAETQTDYAFPCFTLAKALRLKPAQIAEDLATHIHPSDWIESAAANGPYLNIRVARRRFVAWALERIREEKDTFGCSDEGAGRTVVVEFSSPNIAKHLGVHHIRSTMIGNALTHIFTALGYKAVSINFLGDWGTQFGILMAAYRKWGDAATLEGDAVSNLNALYVRFNQEAKENPALRDEGRAWFKRLEEGDPEATNLWLQFRAISMAEFQKVYDILGVSFEVISGESLYDKLMPSTIARLERMGLAKMDQGALIVDLSAHKMPPVILRKSDGATLYDTRDIAAAEDRWEKYHFARMIYVVGGEQKLHFRQIFTTLEMMGYDWAKTCTHVDFGMLRFQGAKMSGRAGQVVMLRQLLAEAVERARQAIEQKNPELPNKEAVAAAVGIGAVVFNDLKRQRSKDVDFDWDAILSFEGETGPYVQYAHVRLCSILRKYGRQADAMPQSGAEPGANLAKVCTNLRKVPRETEGKPVDAAADLSLLTEPEEFALAKALAEFNSVIRRAAENCEPSAVSQYLLGLCGLFSTYYHKHKVLGEDPALTAARIRLVDALRQVIANGLRLLGMQTPEEM